MYLVSHHLVSIVNCDCKFQNQSLSGNYHHANRMFAANQQIGVATTLPHSSEVLHVPQNMAASVDTDHGHSAHSTHSQDDRFSHRETNVTGSEVSLQHIIVCTQA